MAKNLKGKKKPIPKIYQDVKDSNLVIEVRDSRLPVSSGVRFLQSKFGSKKRVIVLSKSDLVSKEYLKGVQRELMQRGEDVFCLNSTGSRGRVLRFFNDLAHKYTPKTSLLGVLRVSVVGLPNVGKSTLINAIRGKSVARAANSPGVTKGRQWIKISNKCYLLDSPGVATLTVSGDIEKTMKFAACRMISEGEYDFESLSMFLMDFAKKHRPELNFSTDILDINDDFGRILSKVAVAYNLKLRGGDLDGERAARKLFGIIEKEILPDLDLDKLIK